VISVPEMKYVLFNEFGTSETFFEFHWTQIGALISLKSVSSVYACQKETSVVVLKDGTPIFLLYFRLAKLDMSCLSRVD